MGRYGSGLAPPRDDPTRLDTRPKKSVYCPAPSDSTGTRLIRPDGYPTRFSFVFFKRLLNPDLNRLVPIVVLGERREFLGCVCPVLGLAHEDGGSVGPNPGEIRVVAGDGRERKIGPSESKMERNHFTSPIEDSRRFETFQKSAVVVVENTWQSTPLGMLEVLGHVNNDSGQIGLWSGAEHLT